MEPKIGRILEQAREERGISLHQAEQATKIRARYLQELERGTSTYCRPCTCRDPSELTPTTWGSTQRRLSGNSSTGRRLEKTRKNRYPDDLRGAALPVFFPLVRRPPRATRRPRRKNLSP